MMLHLPHPVLLNTNPGVDTIGPDKEALGYILLSPKCLTNMDELDTMVSEHSSIVKYVTCHHIYLVYNMQFLPDLFRILPLRGGGMILGLPQQRLVLKLWRIQALLFSEAPCKCYEIKHRVSPQCVYTNFE